MTTNVPGYSIRTAEPRDLDAIFELVMQFATSFQPERAAFNIAAEHLLVDDSARLLVAANQDEIVGYCLGFDHFTFYANGRVSWVEEIMVKTEYRRLGIGQLLMAHFEAWATARQSRLIALATRRAAPFYLAAGYEESAVYFRKRLTPSTP